jgi:fumarate reductase subunit D
MSEQDLPRTTTLPKALSQVGFWSAILTTVWLLIFDLTIPLGAAGAPTRSIAVGASLLLALSFIVLMVSITNYAPAEKRFWSQIGLSFAIVYAALLVWNYSLQLTVVRSSPHLYSWLTMDSTPASAFWALEIMGYTLMGLAGVFALPVFHRGGIELAIRWCFAINAVCTVGGAIGYVLSGNPFQVLVLMSLGVWAIVFPVATALLAVVFKRAEQRKM